MGGRELVALANSQLERHTDAVLRALDQHHPRSIRLTALRTLGRLHGDAARMALDLMQENVDKEITKHAQEAYAGVHLLQQDPRRLTITQKIAASIAEKAHEI